MLGLRDIKRKARRDLHLGMQVPAYYIRTPDVSPVLIHVRLHDKFNHAGDIQGSRTYPAQMENAGSSIRFDLTEIPAIQRNAVVSFAAGEAYNIDHTLPSDGEFQTALVTRVTVGPDDDPIPFPPAGTL